MVKTFDIPEILDNNSLFNEAELDPPSFDENIETLTIEDIDRAIFEFINDNLNIHVKSDNTLKKVPVIFASGERWALVRQRKALRDENGTIILPLISIRRTEIDRSYEASLPAGNAAHKSVVFKVKRSPKNSNFQNLRNSVGLVNQTNAAKNFGTTIDGPAAKTSRRLAAKAFSGTVFRGKQIVSKNKPEIVDVFTIPYPDFARIDYEITFWAQYQEEINQMLHRYFNDFSIFSIDQFQVNTKKGYYFMAFGRPDIANESNVEEFTDTERIIRQTMFLECPIYFIQTQVGEEHLVHKFTSAPEISFVSYAINDEIEDDMKSLKQRNPIEEAQGRLTDIEDGLASRITRPREKRKEHRALTNKAKRRQTGETVTTFSSVEELDRFFK